MKKIFISSFLLIFFLSCSKKAETFTNQFYYTYGNKKFTYTELLKESYKIPYEEIKNIVENKYNVIFIPKLNNKEIQKLDIKYIKRIGNVSKIDFKNKDKIIYVVEGNNKIEIINYKKTKNGLTLLNRKKIDNYSKYRQELFEKFNSDHFTSLDNSELNKIELPNLCQRKAGETQSECEDREYDEFVEDCWVCFVAYWTNPGIAVLIAALCTCYE